MFRRARKRKHPAQRARKMKPKNRKQKRIPESRNRMPAAKPKQNSLPQIRPAKKSLRHPKSPRLRQKNPPPRQKRKISESETNVRHQADALRADSAQKKGEARPVRALAFEKKARRPHKRILRRAERGEKIEIRFAGKLFHCNAGNRPCKGG